MACSCRNRARYRYRWTSEDGTETAIYDSEIVAKAKVIRKGGSYEPIKGN